MKLAALFEETIRRTKHSEACWGYGDAALGELVRKHEQAVLKALRLLENTNVPHPTIPIHRT